MHNHVHPKFSIITVTYNAGAVLEDTIQSVITQTYRNVEYIIVDGGSKDHTLDIINRYREHIHTLVSEPDKGLYDAMNKGIRLATGDYLCFLNAGDELHEDDTLQLMVHSITGTELPDVLYGETAIVDEEGHFLRMRRLSAPEDLNWKSFKDGMLVCHQAFFPRRELAEPYDLRYRFSADFDWCIRIMKKSQYASQYPSHPDRLPERRRDHPQPPRFPSRTVPHHVPSLRLSVHPCAPCVVCPAPVAQEVTHHTVSSS